MDLSDLILMTIAPSFRLSFASLGISLLFAMFEKQSLIALGFVLLALLAGVARAEDKTDDLKPDTVVNDLVAGREGSRTDAEVVAREEEAIQLDGLSVAEMRELRERSEKHAFQVSRSRLEGRGGCFTFLTWVFAGRGQSHDETHHQLVVQKQRNLPQGAHFECLRCPGQDQVAPRILTLYISPI